MKDDDQKKANDNVWLDAWKVQKKAYEKIRFHIYSLKKFKCDLVEKMKHFCMREGNTQTIHPMSSSISLLETMRHAIVWYVHPGVSLRAHKCTIIWSWMKTEALAPELERHRGPKASRIPFYFYHWSILSLRIYSNSQISNIGEIPGIVGISVFDLMSISQYPWDDRYRWVSLASSVSVYVLTIRLCHSSVQLRMLSSNIYVTRHRLWSLRLTSTKILFATAHTNIIAFYLSNGPDISFLRLRSRLTLLLSPLFVAAIGERFLIDKICRDVLSLIWTCCWIN